MKKVNVAIIGAGIGYKHYIAYRALPDLYTVTAVCDMNTARAAAFIEDDSGVEITSDFEAVLANPEIELIDICLPPHLHFDFTARAMRAGKDVICEKPLSNSVADVDRLIAISKETGRTVYPVFQYRFGNGIARLRALIDSGLAGRAYVAAMETHWNRDADYYAVDWRGTWKGEQGGVILGHAIHMHDLLSFILGPVDSVFARLDTRVNDIEVEDCGALSIQMSSGALATSSVTLGAGNDTSRLRFCFEGVTAESGSRPYAPAEDNWTFVARAPVTQGQIDAVIAATPDQSGGQVGFSLQVYNAMRGLESEVVNIDEARRSIEFVSAVYQSSRTGAPVHLPLNVGDSTYDGWEPAPV
ncbi:Gfo/Idh/MocA family protein [Celeribacter marinus]|uniref:Myo-inositol 2-dehydrogenase n=1 Tax=Celeribacter marinus TaxID=1397108 RepID=A0A0P0A6B6_9RHOB|nr:Gfo/Idh/MocA family oxidoreductase [Celeribacter marinus]ALI56194.1 myo-inositol 2-dehydrogenase [Celeribacter marinus]SFK85462.1 Predicted dehydrogenase [Celeribacter marinus]